MRTVLLAIMLTLTLQADEALTAYTDKCAEQHNNVILCTAYANTTNETPSAKQLCVIACTEPEYYRKELRDER